MSLVSYLSQRPQILTRMVVDLDESLSVCRALLAHRFFSASDLSADHARLRDLFRELVFELVGMLASSGGQPIGTNASLVEFLRANRKAIESSLADLEQVAAGRASPSFSTAFRAVSGLILQRITHGELVDTRLLRRLERSLHRHPETGRRLLLDLLELARP